MVLPAEGGVVGTAKGRRPIVFLPLFRAFSSPPSLSPGGQKNGPPQSAVTPLLPHTDDGVEDKQLEICFLPYFPLVYSTSS